MNSTEQLKRLIAEKLHIPESKNPLIEAIQIATFEPIIDMSSLKMSQQDVMESWIYDLSLKPIEYTINFIEQTTNITLEEMVENIKVMDKKQMMEYLVLEVMSELILANRDTF